MLDVLKKLEYQGGSEGLLFFLCEVIGNNGIRTQDAEIICSHAPERRYLSVKDLLGYCLTFGWVTVEADVISISPSIAMWNSDRTKLNKELIQSTVDQLFRGGVFNSSLFSYDSVQGCYAFKNELLPLAASAVRNVLISQGFLIVERDVQGTKFYIESEFDTLVAKHCKASRKQLSLEKLKKILEDNELAGEKAEQYVLCFEKKRIGQPLCDSIKRISEVDASAGYDIVSYNSCQSQTIDRFIEVKAISNSGFYWSRNEYEIAKLKGESYYLYLVELGRINDLGYSPEMIQNPAQSVMESDIWFVETESFHIRPV